MKRFTPPILIGLSFFLFILPILNPTTVRGEMNGSKTVDEFHEMRREADAMKVLSVLGKKIGDQKLLEKTKEKLLTLKDSEFVLITSLSEQINLEGQGPGLDIALLLITALIILS